MSGGVLLALLLGPALLSALLALLPPAPAPEPCEQGQAECEAGPGARRE